MKGCLVDRFFLHTISEPSVEIWLKIYEIQEKKSRFFCTQKRDRKEQKIMQKIIIQKKRQKLFWKKILILYFILFLYHNHKINSTSFLWLVFTMNDNSSKSTKFWLTTVNFVCYETSKYFWNFFNKEILWAHSLLKVSQFFKPGVNIMLRI